MITQFSVDQMSVYIHDDKYQLGSAAADLGEKYISTAINERGHAVIILATGASQFESLNSLTQRQIDWRKVVAFHLDEYVGLSAGHPASFRRYLRERIIDKVGIPTFHSIAGDADDVEKECARLESLLRQYVVDVAFVGIGENGHLAFNDPPARFEDAVKFKIVQLDEVSRRQQLGEGWFKTLDEIPKQAITMTIPAIVASKAIVCTVPDARKAQAVKNTLMNDITPEFPASILRRHPEATLLLDRFSASLLNRKLK